MGESEMRPLNKYVVIDIAQDPVSKGGIWLPDNMRNDYTGVVVEKGPDCTGSFGTGDVVLFRQGSMLCARKNLLVVHEENILAVIEE